jgi:hypothetical protein
MNTQYPLPASNNQRMLGFIVNSGALNMQKIVWAGCFFKKDEEMSNKHVFLTQNNMSEYTHCYWPYDSKHPLILSSEQYSIFDLSLATKKSNRYLFKLNGQSFFLPYLPPSLHDKHFNLKMEFCDNGNINGCYKMHHQFCRKVLKRRKRNIKFKGFKKIKSSTLTKYKKYIINFNVNMQQKHHMNLNIPIEALDEQQKELLDQASLLLHMVFPNLFKV